jgi:host factor-I protein
MSPAKDARGPAQSPNIQDVFLNHARRERLAVSIRFMDGAELEGRIKNFDRFAIVVESAGADQMIFKHAIAAIRSGKSIANYYASHES